MNLTTNNISQPLTQVVFGRNLIEECKNFVHAPFLIVTMKDIWERIEPRVADAHYKVYFVQDTKEETLIRDLNTLPSCHALVGIGGGQAIDVAKYFAWKTQLPLFQFPTILSVDAMFGQRSGIRREGKVYYVGWARPECVFFDYDIIRSAPIEMNISGIGDTLCLYTGVLDWQYSHKKGMCSPQWQYNEELATHSIAQFENILMHKNDIARMTDLGIQCLVNAFRWGGESYFTSGWCPCHVEGTEHFFFYTLEYLTQKKFLHGKPVSLGVYIAALMHEKRSKEILDYIVDVGLDIRPESMGILWKDVEEALRYMNTYVHELKLWHSIAHDFSVTQDFIEHLQKQVNAAYNS